jgi:hypothetical protein
MYTGQMAVRKKRSFRSLLPANRRTNLGKNLKTKTIFHLTTRPLHWATPLHPLPGLVLHKIKEPAPLAVIPNIKHSELHL